MITISETLLIEQPLEEVFAAVADPQQQRIWDAAALKQVEPLQDGPLRQGARYRGTFAGTGVVEYEYAEYVPGERFAHRSRLPLGELYHTFVFEPVGQGTRLVQTTRLAPSGVWRLAAPLLRPVFRRRLREMNQRIRAYLQP